jgi:hypothetical protein
LKQISSRRPSLAAGTSLFIALIALTSCGSSERSAVTTASNPAAVPTEGISEQASVPGPVQGTRITEAYARMVARDSYFWAWPMINIYNRRLAFAKAPEPGIMNYLPFAPLNRLAMLSDYVEPSERWVACPNQDVVYGATLLALDQSPAVVQVPDFGRRFWVYQAVDLRTDSFADIGSMYGSKPGFYLLVGPDWKGEAPNGIARVFRSKTQTGMIAPRVFQDDTPADKQAVQTVLRGVDVYPLSMFDGKMKTRDWRNIKKYPSQPSGAGETRWVFPDKFFDQLPAVLNDAKPLPGEQARYAEVLSVIAAAQKDPGLKRAMVDEANKADGELVGPLLQFRNFGVQLPANWVTINNGASFGTDYFTRTAVARSNILVNKPVEAKYYYQDLDKTGVRLNGSKRYTVTFPAGQLPPVKGFWSLTMYDQYHFFAPNGIKRYSIGTKNRDLKTNSDGSLTIYVQADAPTDPAQRTNWLPAPHNADFSLFVRAYWPEQAALNNQWTPPAVEKQ